MSHIIFPQKTFEFLSSAKPSEVMHFQACWAVTSISQKQNLVPVFVL